MPSRSFTSSSLNVLTSSSFCTQSISAGNHYQLNVFMDKSEIKSVDLFIGFSLREPVVHETFHCHPSVRVDLLQLLYQSSISAGNCYRVNVFVDYS